MTIRALPMQPGRGILVYRANALALGAAEEYNTPIYDPADTWFSSREISAIRGAFRSTQAGAASTCKLEESNDGISVHLTTVLADEDTNTLAGANKTVPIVKAVTLPFWRISWTNGATPGVLNGSLFARGI